LIADGELLSVGVGKFDAEDAGGAGVKKQLSFVGLGLDIGDALADIGDTLTDIGITLTDIGDALADVGVL